MERAEKEHILFESILLLANKMQNLGDKYLHQFTLKQWFLLMMMSRMEQTSPSVREIADFTGTSRQNVKQMLEILEKNGFVEMTKSKRDSRALNVSLTRKCLKYFEESGQEGDVLIASLFGGIPEDELDAALEMFRSLFVRVYAMQQNLEE